ncbi:bifunctional 2-C-methyl-D-erythritol 4-phosphate cytidylyltransferase/2-C-methyl-D-erythritol 2,4-cyclodiphosphate synthase [Roseicyclus sp. F158]|uniref:Bifunctional enzyme IspD/IspF n=1 Tax=Tropicimonas omnivorans TaxID=3075590 RepID=A0ABU3DJS7_9RHOB|nr:bifunctional 2-C-methyl-D-erythritol 4-phosphate cytidylyltransferase/2-C-methyl-D-erythritol 2,4-cyclodiphosphate synthase [Roseicyclus sp. F158]MDT0683974.1 bifunctional 2-C-methyl-D-erythritol 4-phosphate cytidylyltransferase/2-C-methyl-D-erythritol 2,4-cyclodiphosphate synthase [Roseicyclus sp. F158]
MTDVARRVTDAILVAGGKGTRMGGQNKVYRLLAGQPVLGRSAAAFLSHPGIRRVVAVVAADDAEAARAILPEEVTIATGGASRAASVRAGLAALSDAPPDRVMIHDAARPLIDRETIARVSEALDAHDGAAPAIAVTDALWRSATDRIEGAVPREGLYRAQTPQGFRYEAIAAAHAGWDAPGDPADDVTVALAAGLDVVMVPGEERNLKLTLAADMRRAEAMTREGTPMDIRMGNGYDVHRFGPGDAVILCGIRIPHGRGLSGHSDADVGMHALTDAILGALAEGDIGRHFPPSDPQWKGADSEIFLSRAADIASGRGFRLSNADVTLICEEPKIGPHAAAMSARLAGILGTTPDRISVKATTSERLGFTGRGEGIAAIATATLVSETS